MIKMVAIVLMAKIHTILNEKKKLPLHEEFKKYIQVI